MANNYVPVLWNRQKKLYDRVLLAFVVGYLILFAGLQMALFPEISIETLIIRATGTLAFFLLHFILIIGPLSRINPVFLPLLYNRRHLGVTMFLIALVHGVFNIIQFHALGNTDPLVSIFSANPAYDSLVNFPFQTLGFFALIILFLMAATSHDFWLKNLSPRVWKGLHMGVYFAYGLLVMHVLLGVVQLEQSPLWHGTILFGLLVVTGFHLVGARANQKQKLTVSAADADKFHRVCPVTEILPSRAKVVQIDGEDIAIFRDGDKLTAVSNRCRHQQGPLGEGQIVDGCITCPWHGYQYYPHNGQSPPPFTEKLNTYDVKIAAGAVWVNPTPYPEGTERPCAQIKAN